MFYRQEMRVYLTMKDTVLPHKILIDVKFKKRNKLNILEKLRLFFLLK